jgi:Ca2+-binding RTX toxin-like protein
LRRMRRGVFALLLAAVALSAPSASAHQDPPGCSQASPHYDWGGIYFLRNGDTAHITASVGNDNPAPIACDITNATIKLQVPAADGSPGKTFTLATGVDIDAGAAPVQMGGTKDYKVDFDPGVFRGWVTIEIDGIVHNGLTETFGFIGSSSSPLKISRPHVKLTVAPVVTPGLPATVTYTYTAENNSAVDPEPGGLSPSLFNPVLADDKCASPSGPTGDAGTPGWLEPAETWTWTSTTNLPATGSFVNAVTFDGVSTADGGAWPTARGRKGICDAQVATTLGTDLRNQIEGTTHRDVIVAGGGNDVVEALAGNDLVCGGAGADTLRGGRGNDRLRGEGGDDTLVGGPGTDTLLGGPGHDSTQH